MTLTDLIKLLIEKGFKVNDCFSSYGIELTNDEVNIEIDETYITIKSEDKTNENLVKYEFDYLNEETLDLLINLF